MASIPTLTFLSTVRVALEISSTKDFKMELVEMPQEEYLVDRWISLIPLRLPSRKTATWRLELQKLHLPRALKEDVASHIKFIARRLSKWCHYNKFALDLDPMACIRNLKPSFFTPRGRIEKRRAAEEMARDEQLDVCDRFAVACFYALETDVVHLWTLLSETQKRDFCNGIYPRCVLQQSDAVKLWPQYLTTEFQTLASGNMDRSYYELILDVSLDFANDVAVRICYEKLYPESRELASEMATTRLMNLLTNFGSYFVYAGFWRNATGSLRPDTFFDILSFLFAQMTDIEMERFVREDAMEGGGSTVLESLLAFWCDDQLLDFARILWTNVTEESYVRLVTKIHDRRVAEEFWHESPDHYKHYLLNNEEAFDSMCADINPDVLDGILAVTTPDERRYLISSFKTDPRVSVDQVRLGKYDVAIILVKYFDLTSERWRIKLKTELDICIDSCSNLDTLACDYFGSPSNNHFLGFLVNLEVVCKLIDLCLEFEEDGTKALVKSQFATGIGIELCRMLLIGLEFQKVDNFLSWCFSGQREVGDYKKVLYEKRHLTIHLDVINGHGCSSLDGVFDWFGLSPSEVRDHKLRAMLHVAETLTEDSFKSKICHGVRILQKGTAAKKCGIRDMLAWHLADREAAVEFRKMWSIHTSRKPRRKQFKLLRLTLDEMIRDMGTMARKKV